MRPYIIKVIEVMLPVRLIIWLWIVWRVWWYENKGE